MKRLVSVSDVVVENMRAGTMDRIGLGYEELRQVNPKIIMLSSSARGATGPESHYAGYATVHHAVGGASYITGYPDGPPSTTFGDVDLMNATAAAFAVIAALHHRAETGEGQFIDYSQCEGVSSLIGEVLLDYEMNGRSPGRQGNADELMAPHNVYQLLGSRPLARHRRGDRRGVCRPRRVIGHPELAADPRFADADSRKRNEAELDRIISEWTRARDRDFVANTLAGEGSPPPRRAPPRTFSTIPTCALVAPSSRSTTLSWGLAEFVGPPWKMSGCEVEARHAPLLGEHNDYVFRELLGMDEEKINQGHIEGLFS